MERVLQRRNGSSDPADEIPEGVARANRRARSRPTHISRPRFGRHARAEPPLALLRGNDLLIGDGGAQRIAVTYQEIAAVPGNDLDVSKQLVHAQAWPSVVSTTAVAPAKSARGALDTRRDRRC
jgi:hypothetical protein